MQVYVIASVLLLSGFCANSPIDLNKLCEAARGGEKSLIRSYLLRIHPDKNPGSVALHEYFDDIFQKFDHLQKTKNEKCPEWTAKIRALKGYTTKPNATYLYIHRFFTKKGPIPEGIEIPDFIGPLDVDLKNSEICNEKLASIKIAPVIAKQKYTITCAGSEKPTGDNVVRELVVIAKAPSTNETIRPAGVVDLGRLCEDIVAKRNAEDPLLDLTSHQLPVIRAYFERINQSVNILKQNRNRDCKQWLKSVPALKGYTTKPDGTFIYVHKFSASNGRIPVRISLPEFLGPLDDDSTARKRDEIINNARNNAYVADNYIIKVAHVEKPGDPYAADNVVIHFLDIKKVQT